jgi:hypothetical protein
MELRFEGDRLELKASNYTSFFSIIATGRQEAP